MLEGKKLSILGDSISTYEGVSNNASVSATTALNAYFYRPVFPLEKTYFSILMSNLGLTLCVNNSYAGGNLSGVDDPTSGVNRVFNLSADDGSTPDLIIVFMGINDLGRRVDPAVFSNDYLRTLSIIKEKYPSASVCCVNLPDRDCLLKKQTIIYNNIINDVVKAAGERFFVADIFGSRLNNDTYYMNTVDGLHPDEDGMRIIAEIIAEAIKCNLRV